MDMMMATVEQAAETDVQMLQAFCGIMEQIELADMLLVDNSQSDMLWGMEA